MPKKIILASFFIFTLSAYGLETKAAEFDPTYLISDTEMTDYRSLDQPSIQKFLDKRAGTLKNYITIDKEGNFKSASQSFYEIAQRWMINPKYLMILTQKEQSLLEDSSPSQGQYDRATGYGCPDSGGCDDRWKGLYRQVNSAAAQTRYYMDNISEFNFQPGKTYNIDGQSVTIKNTATAGLYNYTPHIHGNKLFWDLWNNYFSRKWPDGSLLQSTTTADVYFIQNSLKRKILSKSILISMFDQKKIVSVTDADLASYQDGVPIKFHNFDLIKDKAGNIYLIVDDQKRKFESLQLFKKIGYQEDELIEASETDLALYTDGAPITQYSLYPSGALLRDKTTKKLYYALNGVKREVINKEILDFNFNGLTIKTVAPEELENYIGGNPITLRDGELIKIKGVSTVYVISNGKRLPIFSSAVFQRMGYKWNNIKTVSKETLEVHPLGQTITGDW